MNGIYFEEFKNSYIPHILKEIYIEQVYKPYLEDKKDLTILDIGANIGLFSMYAHDYAKQIITVEPSAEHFKTLNYNITKNKLEDKVTTVQKAIAHYDGTTVFYHSSNKTMFSMKKEVSDNGIKEEVETITLETLFKDYNIKHVDFMKLDIEGTEHEVVGSEGFQNVADKIDTMIVEWHQWSGYNPDQLVTTLRDYGFAVQQIPADATLFLATRL